MNFLNLFGAHQQLKEEKARLEAFLSAVPGEYCGFARDGSVVYSKGFCEALGLSRIDRFSDVQNAVGSADGLALENYFARLLHEGEAFCFNLAQGFKISGTCGEDLEGQDRFHILWLEKEVAAKENNAVADFLSYPVWERDLDQKIIWCNRAYCDFVGLLPEDIIAQQKEIVQGGRKRKKAVLLGADLARAALEKGVRQSSDVHEVIGGGRRLLRICEIPAKKDNGGGTVGFLEDITAQEEFLQKTEDERGAFQALLEQLRSAIAIYGADERLEFYNSAFAQLWGLEDGWLNTRPKLGEIMEKLRETRRLPEQADFRSFKKSWLDMFTSLIDPYEDMLYLPDGSALRMLVVAHKTGGLMMNFEDVSSRLELESSYNTLIAVQKDTLDNLEEGVTVYGGDGRLKLWNPSFASLWGFDPEALSGEPHITQLVEKVSSYFNDTDWLKIKKRIISLALERDLHHGRMERADESVLDYSTLPLPDGGVLVTFSDVTDTVRVENVLREKNVALEAAEQLKLDFLANVSYQLRTPLSAIMGFNEMLDQEFFGSLNEKQKEYTRDIHGASERLLGLINDILDLSTIEAGQMDLDIAEISVKEMMGSIYDLVADWVRKGSVDVRLKCPANIGKAFLDQNRIKQAMLNLVRNAIAHTEAGGVIELCASRVGDEVRLCVRDNGAGIADQDQERVLQPFEKVEKAQGERGAGLGLTLVKNIVDLHHGRFELESQEGEGTQVALILPRTGAGQ